MDRSDFHFVCFICKDNKIYEMDGGKVMPVDHGPTTPESFLEVEKMAGLAKNKGYCKSNSKRIYKQDKR